MKAIKPAAHGLEMKAVADEAEVLLDLRMAGVVPVDDCGIAEFLEEGIEVALERDLLERLAIFDAELDAARLGFVDNFPEQFECALDVGLLLLLPLFDGLGQELSELRRVLFSIPGQFDKSIRVILHVDGAGVKDDEFGADADGRVEGLESVFEGAFTLAVVLGGKLVDVGRGALDAHGERAKVVEAGNLDLSGLDSLKDTRQQADADAVAELGEFETEVANLAEHCAAIGVAVRVPAGGHRVHTWRSTRERQVGC